MRLITILSKHAKLDLRGLSENCAMIVNIRVRAEYIGQGHGKRLLKCGAFKETCSTFKSVYAFSDKKTAGFWAKMGEREVPKNAPLEVKTFIKMSNVKDLCLFKIK